MRNILLITFLALCSCAKTQDVNLVLGRTQTGSATVASTVIDDGLYNAFSMVEQRNNVIYSWYKKAGSHAGVGPFTLAQSANGGTTWTEAQINISGTLVNITALSGGFLASGRHILAYQDNEQYTSIKFAYRDGTTGNFTASTTINFPALDITSLSPIRIIIMPSGKILCAYYQVVSGDTPYKVAFMQSTDNGLTWGLGPTIFSNTANAPAGLGNWKGHEAGIVITHNTGVDATCKLIAVVRTNIANEGGTYYMHYKSADGATTWTTDLTEDAGSFTNDNGVFIAGPFTRHLQYSFLPGNSPVDLIMHNGLVYIINGERNGTNGFKIKYTTATPDGAFANVFSSWIRPIAVTGNLNAFTLGTTIDVGYPIAFKGSGGALWIHYYDVSTLPQNPVITTRRTLIQQIKIVN